jgi:hypothetical protein
MCGAVFTSAGEKTAYSTNKITAGIWHQFIQTWDGNNLFGYIDGAQVFTREAGGTINQANNPVRIGGTSFGTAFGGYIDDVRIYNRALTSNEGGETHFLNHF